MKLMIGCLFTWLLTTEEADEEADDEFVAEAESSTDG